MDGWIGKKDAAVQRKNRGHHTVLQGIKTKCNPNVVRMLLCYKMLQATCGLPSSLAPRVFRFDGGAVAVLPAPALAVPPTLLPGLANTPLLSAPGC